MAYTNLNGLNGRMEELRFSHPNIRSAEVEAPFSVTMNSSRDSNPFFTALPSGNDIRGTLQRRFTTDSSKLPMGRNSGQQYAGFNSNTVRVSKRHCVLHLAVTWSNRGLGTIAGVSIQQTSVKQSLPPSVNRFLEYK